MRKKPKILLARKLSPASLTTASVIVVLAALAAYVVVNTGRADTTIPRPSGLPWASGVWPYNSAAVAQQFATMRGRANDVVQISMSQDSWANYVSNWWEQAQYIGTTGSVSIDWPIHPINVGTIAAAAAGSYDSYYQQAASNVATLVSQGRQPIVRIGWEFNMPNGMNTATNNADWKAAYRRIVGIVRAKAPTALLEYSFSSGQVGPTGDIFGSYPGDDVVDIISTDSYDAYYPAVDEASWTNQMNRVGGLVQALNLAKQHGKKLAVAEWGLGSNGPASQWAGAGGGDNPFYIQKMWEWFQARAAEGILAYECYFDDPESWIDSSLLNGHNPNASAKYAGLYKAGVSSPSPTATPTPPVTGDLSGDGKVNVYDLSILLSKWGTNYAAADLNHDGVVNVFDLSVVLSHWTG